MAIQDLEPFHCPRCSYYLGFLTSARCPECGLADAADLAIRPDSPLLFRRDRYSWPVRETLFFFQSLFRPLRNGVECRLTEVVPLRILIQHMFFSGTVFLSLRFLGYQATYVYLFPRIAPVNHAAWAKNALLGFFVPRGLSAYWEFALHLLFMALVLRLFPAEPRRLFTSIRGAILLAHLVAQKEIFLAVSRLAFQTFPRVPGDWMTCWLCSDVASLGGVVLWGLYLRFFFRPRFVCRFWMYAYILAIIMLEFAMGPIIMR